MKHVSAPNDFIWRGRFALSEYRYHNYSPLKQQVLFEEMNVTLNTNGDWRGHSLHRRSVSMFIFYMGDNDIVMALISLEDLRTI